MHLGKWITSRPQRLNPAAGFSISLFLDWFDDLPNYYFVRILLPKHIFQNIINIFKYQDSI